MSAWVYPQQKTRRTQPRQQEPCEACRPDRIPLLQKTRYRNSDRCVGAPCSWTYLSFSRNLSRKQHHAPPSGAKSASTAPGKLLSRSTSNCVFLYTTRQITLRNKIPETLELGCLCNGMKTLISDHDYELHLGGTAKPGRLAAGSVLDPGGPVRLDQWGAFNLDGRRPRPSSQGDRGKEIRKRFWTQSHDRGPREDYRQFPNCCANGEGPRHCHLGAR